MQHHQSSHQHQGIPSPNSVSQQSVTYPKSEEYSKPYMMASMSGGYPGNQMMGQGLDQQGQQVQKQAQHYNFNFNNNVLSNSNGFPVSQQPSFPNTAASSSTNTTSASIFTNQMHPSRVGTPLEYQPVSYDMNVAAKSQIETQPQQPAHTQSQNSNQGTTNQQLHSQAQNRDQSQNQSTVLPSINALSLPPLNLNQK